MKASGTGQIFLQVVLSLAFLLWAGISTYGQQKRVIAGLKGFPYSGGIHGSARSVATWIWRRHGKRRINLPSEFQLCKLPIRGHLRG